MESLRFLVNLLPVLILLLLGWTVGRTAERLHFRSIRQREEALAHVLVTDVRTFPPAADPSAHAAVVMSEVVIATDYLKTFLAGLRKIVGGELRSYESLMARARREVVLRLMEQAVALGYDAVCNVRLNTADIGGGTMRKRAAMVELMATGTAYRRASGSEDGQEVGQPVGL